MKEYDVYLPLHYNDGRRVEATKVEKFKRLAVEHFGGLTHFPQENEGVWKFGGVTFRDRISILRVLSDDLEGARRFFEAFREQLGRELEQEAVLIVEKDVCLVSARKSS